MHLAKASSWACGEAFFDTAVCALDVLVRVAVDAGVLLVVLRAAVLLCAVWLGERPPQPAIRAAPASTAIIVDLIRSRPLNVGSALVLRVGRLRQRCAPKSAETPLQPDRG
jgi:hypothetical protein